MGQMDNIHELTQAQTAAFAVIGLALLLFGLFIGVLAGHRRGYLQALNDINESENL